MAFRIWYGNRYASSPRAVDIVSRFGISLHIIARNARGPGQPSCHVRWPSVLSLPRRRRLHDRVALMSAQEEKRRAANDHTGGKRWEQWKRANLVCHDAP